MSENESVSDRKRGFYSLVHFSTHMHVSEGQAVLLYKSVCTTLFPAWLLHIQPHSQQYDSNIRIHGAYGRTYIFSKGLVQRLSERKGHPFNTHNGDWPSKAKEKPRGKSMNHGRAIQN